MKTKDFADPERSRADVRGSQRARDFAHLPGENAFQRKPYPPVVHRAQRFGSPSGPQGSRASAPAVSASPSSSRRKSASNSGMSQAVTRSSRPRCGPARSGCRPGGPTGKKVGNRRRNAAHEDYAARRSSTDRATAWASVARRETAGWPCPGPCGNCSPPSAHTRPGSQGNDNIGFWFPTACGLAYTKEQSILSGSCFRLMAGAVMLAVSLWGPMVRARERGPAGCPHGKAGAKRGGNWQGRSDATVSEAVVAPPTLAATAHRSPANWWPGSPPSISSRRNWSIRSSRWQAITPDAVSPKGALGLMQLIPATARPSGVSDVFDPADNIQGGVQYLKYLRIYCAVITAGSGRQQCRRGCGRRGWQGANPIARLKDIQAGGEPVEEAFKATAAAQFKAAQEVKPAPAPPDGVT